MGLLSDPEAASGKWISVIKKVHRPLSFVLCLCSVIWFVMMGNKNFNNGTYFSENALLPGLVRSEFSGDSVSSRYYKEFIEEIRDKYQENDEIPVPWLVGKMSQIGLEVYVHNYSLNYPLGREQKFQGQNVYGILRAARSSSIESLVVSVPYRPPSSPHKGTASGIALMLAFAEFARPQKYWAKDLIFLVTEHEQLGMQAWLEAYHGIDPKVQSFQSSLGAFWRNDYNNIFGPILSSSDSVKWLNSGNLKGRSGAIQAAINLEFNTPKIKYIEVKVEGLNGQLPNLDLVNLVHKLCENNGIHHSFKNSFSWVNNYNEKAKLIESFWTLVAMASTQVPGVPNGNHGLFHRFGIEAVTLEGRYVDDIEGQAPRVNGLSSVDFGHLCYMLEGVLRSLNNLLERFHQSYFFYLLAGIDRFVSIGQYMPCLCFLCGALLIRALALWFTMHANEDLKSKTKTKEQLNETKAKCDVVSVGGNFLLAHVFGYIAMMAPKTITQLGAIYFNLPTENALYGGLMLYILFLRVVAPYVFTFIHKGPPTHDGLCLTAVLALTELSTVCLSIGLNNFPLGLALAAIYAPFALTVGVVGLKASRIRLTLRFMQQFLLTLLNPLILLTCCTLAYSGRYYSDEPLGNIIRRGFGAAQNALVFSVADSMIYGNWLFNVLAGLILPIWFLLIQLVSLKSCQ